MSVEDVLAVPRWYAVYTHLKQEDRAASNLQAWRVETFNPKLRTYRYNQFSGKPTTIINSLFPRYIFAKFKASELLQKVWFTRGVHSVVNFGDYPAPIDNEIISLIQSRIDKEGFVRVGETFKPGDRVEIKEGPLRNFTGIFEREMNESDRVMILLTTINFQGRVAVEREMVGKLC